MSNLTRALGAAALAAALSTAAGAAQAQYLVIGIDEKTVWDDTAKVVVRAPGKDLVSIVDISDRARPKIVANLPLMNTVLGPPTNVAIAPDEHLALVANSLEAVSDGSGGWKYQPDNKVYAIDLKASPPVQIGTIEVGKQPSGMAINRAGDLALVANRADNTVSVLAIKGKEVKAIGTVALAPQGAPSEQLAAVAIAPDGKRALVAKAASNKVALLKIVGETVTYDGYDMSVGVFPYNVQISPDGRIGIVNNNGSGGASDGGVDTAAIIDLELAPPRVIDHVVVGDGPEGLAISPMGTIAISVILNGTGNVPKAAFFHHAHSYLTILKIDGKKAHKVGEIETGQFTEGVAFSPDGKYLYAENYFDNELAIFKVQGTKLVRAGTLKLPGHPASLRSSTP
ncbi:MAG TPA: beta-propeller fold lactonase family protein [Stellaceae bacterium]|nr:beta-propeller fold lactonase family protein [Stellaceae bacterium]